MVRAWLEASCTAQGVPVVVEDVVALRRVSALLGGGTAGDPGGKRSAPGAPTPDRRREPAACGYTRQ